MHTRLVVYVAGLLLVVAVVGAVTWRLVSGSTPYERALDTLPASTLRSTFIDWAVVRDQADGAALDAQSSEAAVKDFLDRAYDRDLISGSGSYDSTAVLAKRFGFSALDARWEAFGQGRKGQVDVLRMEDGTDMENIERSLRRLGYTVPRVGLGEGGTWVGGEDLVATLDPDLSPLQQNIVVLPDDKLVLMSDDTAYASAAAGVVRGDRDSVLDEEGVADLAARADRPVAAVQWTSTFACEDLTMGSADEEDQAAAERLVDEAGRISPLQGLVMAQQADRSLVVGMHFETSEQASANLQTRVDLASGQAPAQGGTFADRFSVTSGEADGQDVVLTLKPASEQPVLTDVSTGPILFATC